MARGEEPQWDGGFLHECQSAFGRLYNPKPVTFESVESKAQCLVLLGEPGLGKSREIETRAKLTETYAKESGDATLSLDLGEYGTDSSLRQDIFEGPTIRDWMSAKYHLNLFLDSLDEALFSAIPLTRLLARELRNLPRDRLRLRIACRTAVWQGLPSFEDELRELFGNDAVQVFELQPLCRADAESAANANGLDVQRFMNEVSQTDVEAFASKPVTLNLLIELFKSSGTLPNTQAELYRKGCRELCKDSEIRKEARRTGTLDPDQRMILAGRIAAFMIFGNRSTIRLGNDSIDSEGDVTLSNLKGGTEIRDGERFAVEARALQEVLEYTGLFISAFDNRVRWRHQTYAEFLAAWYVRERKLRLSKVLDLILHHGDPEKKVVPQLHETAAWLAGMDQGVFDAVLKAEPEVLLRSDVARADANDRGRLVAALLKIHDDKQRKPSWYKFDILKKLDHPSVAHQLRPYITDSTKWIVARQLAIHIAHACRAKELEGVLADLALDATAPLELRCEAAEAVGAIGDHQTKQRLKPLIGDSPTDPRKELKGSALKAVWPECLTSEELFENLTSGIAHYTGSYDLFVYGLAEQLRTCDLLSALAWLRRRPHRDEAATTFHTLKDAIMRRAWDQCEDPDVCDLFARIALSRMLSYEPVIEDRSALNEIWGLPSAAPFHQLVRCDDTKRRAVLGVMTKLVLEHAMVKDRDAEMWRFSAPENPFLVANDLLWFIQQFECAASEIEREFLALLISSIIRWDDVDHVDALCRAVQRSEPFARRFGRFLWAIDLDSAEAMELRSRYRRSLEMRATTATQRPQLSPSPAERITELLERFEASEYDAWWQLNYWMTLLPDGHSEASEIHPDIRTLPGWQSADEQIKTRIRRAAGEYLLHGQPTTDTWMGADPDRPALGGYKALYLLVSESPNSVASISPSVWKKWAPVVLAFPNTGRQDTRDVQLNLIATAYSHAPDEIVKTLEVLVYRDANRYEIPHIVEKVEACWDSKIANALKDTLNSDRLGLSGRAYLLGKLLVHELAGAREIADAWIQTPQDLPDSVSAALAGGRALMLHTADGGWSVVWPRISGDVEFGRILIEKVASAGEARKDGIAPELKEHQLAEFYMWLERNYPHSEDPELRPGIAYDVTPRHLVGRLRDSILQRLEKFGSRDSCAQIQRIAAEFPELDWMKWVLQSAQSETRRATWTAPTPSEILKHVSDPNSGLVQSGEQLLRVVCESLTELDEKLRAGASHELWNEEPDCRPKREDRLTQKVAAHLRETLERRGVVANREVKVRRGFTDIHVDAVRKDQEGYDTVTVIIEVKGCWHPRLMKAMEAQLINQYLADSRCDHGIFLVGWFSCDQWSPNDSRKNKTPNWSLSEAQAFFKNQAAKLSIGGKVIESFVLNTAL